MRKWLLPGQMSGNYSENSIAKTIRYGRGKCNSFVIARTPMCAKNLTVMPQIAGPALTVKRGGIDVARPGRPSNFHFGFSYSQ
jgi:hypothetical protein